MPPRYSDYHSIQTSRKDRLFIRNDIVDKLLHSRNIVYQTLHPTCRANWSAPLKVDNYLRKSPFQIWGPVPDRIRTGSSYFPHPSIGNRIQHSFSQNLVTTG